MAPWFDAINGLADRNGLPALLAKLHGSGWSSAFLVTGYQDERDATAQLALLYQGGLGLPNKEYYTKYDEKSRDLRAQYVRHVAIMLLLNGASPDQAARDAGTVLRFETRLAEASRTPVELRDPESNYHKLTLAEFAAQAPGFDWPAYFKALGLPEAPLDEWKAYLTWQTLHDAAPYVGQDLEAENFRFYSRTLRGVEEQQPRWKRVLHAVNDGIGEALGQIYVERQFSPEAKARALTLVGDLRAALHDRINAADWMGAETKAAALKKLEAFGVKIGYPDRWRDYSALDIKTQPYVLNVVACQTFEFRRQLAKIGRPVDPTEWEMNTPEVNAYYNPNRNEIVFPAGILQPPYFDPHSDDASNYGSIGAVIGHEMTHGFDDQGRQFDAQGNLKNWWTFADYKRFEERGTRIVAQFDEMEGLPGVHVNGKLTEGENIADLGGLKIAFAAFQKARERAAADPRDKNDVAGLTPSQRFFVAYAQSWRSVQRPEYVRLLISTNPHSPDFLRVNGPVANLPEFADAFGLAPGSAEVRPADKQVNIW